MENIHFDYLETLGNGHTAMKRKSQNNCVLYTSFFRGLIYLHMTETQFRHQKGVLVSLELKAGTLGLTEVRQTTALEYGN
jgi:hypothetical protein